MRVAPSKELRGSLQHLFSLREFPFPLIDDAEQALNRGRIRFGFERVPQFRLSLRELLPLNERCDLARVDFGGARGQIRIRKKVQAKEGQRRPEDAGPNEKSAVCVARERLGSAIPYT